MVSPYAGPAFGRPGATYAVGPVPTWTRPVTDGDPVRVVGVASRGVEARASLADARCRAIERERPFSWYLIAGDAQLMP